MRIRKINAREILDSRGKPTIEVDVTVQKEEQIAIGRFSVPSGASIGDREIKEKRDQQSDRYNGFTVQSSVNKLNDSFFIKHFDCEKMEQELLDKLLINLYNQHEVGGNAIIGISFAFAKGVAKLLKIPLFLYIRTLLSDDFKKKENSSSFPIPMFNMINGGVHANNKLDIQEVMVVPVGATSLDEALIIGAEIFMDLKANLHRKGISTGVGDEGGFISGFHNTRQALDFLMESVERCCYVDKVKLALDVAASELFHEEKYLLRGEKLELTANNIIKYYQSLVQDYPLIAIEDPIDQNDHESWQMITKELNSQVMLVGDDLFCTQASEISKGFNKNIANSVLIKPNQVGTLTDTLNAISISKKYNYKVIVSHRSGETEDSSIAHLAYGVFSDYVKFGSLSRSERLCKYNEMLRIDEFLKNNTGMI